MSRAILALLALSVTSLEALDFTGSLEAVTSRAIHVRLNDGRIVFAILPATEKPEALAAKYRIGDQVKVACSSGPQKYVKEEKAFFQFTATRIRYVRGPSDAELRDAMGSRVTMVEGNLRRIDTHAPTKAAEAADSRLRQAATAYLAALPNYVADETLTRSSGGGKEQTIQSEVVFTGAGETRRHITIDGAP